MPIDAAIPLQAHAPTPIDPLTAAAKIFTLKAASQQAQMGDLQLHDQLTLRQAMRDPGVVGDNGELNFDALMSNAAKRGISSQSLIGLSKAAEDQRAKKLQMIAAQQSINDKLNGYLTQSAASLLPQIDEAAKTLGVDGAIKKFAPQLEQIHQEVDPMMRALGKPHPPLDFSNTQGIYNGIKTMAGRYKPTTEHERVMEGIDKEKAANAARTAAASERRAAAAEQKSEAEKFGKPTALEVKQKDGSVKQVMAQQGANGQWVTADEKRTPIDVSQGFRPVKQSEIGGREAQMLQRSITSALDATADIENLAMLPVTANTGLFGMGHEVAGPSFTEAPKRALLNKITDQDAQQVQVAIKGIGRALAGLATGGVYVNQAIVRQFDMLAPMPGDTYITKMQKLATMRQNADNGIDSMLTNPRLGEEQRKQLEELKDRLGKAIPFLPKDVINYSRQGKDSETFAQYSARVGVGKGGAAQTAPQKKRRPLSAFGN